LVIGNAIPIYKILTHITITCLFTAKYEIDRDGELLFEASLSEECKFLNGKDYT
jgi:hypothetical protein